MSNKNVEVKELTIQDVTASEMSLVNSQQFNFLFKKTPQNCLYKRPAKGGGQWTYVTGAYVKKVLNFITGFNWDFEVVKDTVYLEAGQVIVLGKLTIRLNGESVVKTQYGRSDIKFRKLVQGEAQRRPLDLGNDMKAAATDCLKKCASEFGVAADVYGGNEFKETRVSENTPINTNTELMEEINNCETMEVLESLFTENKAEIMKNVNLLSAYGNAKKIFEYGND